MHETKPKTPAQSLSKNILIDIINKFAADGIIFQNEAQFQHKLALELANQNYDVELEAFSSPSFKNLTDLETADDVIRNYTDIVIKDNSGERVAIELKYKTADKICIYKTENICKGITFKQGADDEGAYDYCADINRIENLVNKHDYYHEGTYIKGFAVILSNNNNYWKSHNPKNVYRQFYLTESSNNKELKLSHGTHELIYSGKSLEKPSTKREKYFKAEKTNGPYPPHTKPLVFDFDYPCNWHDYKLPKEIDDNGYPFRFMISEIPQNKK